jgi:Asp-tRNA(Asn)/Glu-tRNA(Gln) amidotransferase A subunit family amidase
MGYQSEPRSDDFRRVDTLFDAAVVDLGRQGATVIDPIAIPRLRDLLDAPVGEPGEAAFQVWMTRSANPPYGSMAEVLASPDYAGSLRAKRMASRRRGTTHVDAVGGAGTSLREEVLVEVLKVMADLRLDAIVHKTVEHEPTLIAAGVNPPYVTHKGAVFLNTRLIYVPALTVPAGFTSAGLPAGLTFVGRPYADARILQLGYAFEQATRHRRVPATTPPVEIA